MKEKKKKKGKEKRCKKNLAQLTCAVATLGRPISSLAPPELLSSCGTTCKRAYKSLAYHTDQLHTNQSLTKEREAGNKAGAAAIKHQRKKASAAVLSQVSCLGSPNILT